jgi:cytochrome c oxidase subunit II
VLSLIVGFSVRYRKGSSASRADLPELIKSEVEIGWTAATFFLFLFIFWWVGSSQLTNWNPPKNAEEVHVVAKQWMWKTQYPNGIREINSVHAPVGTPVRLVMTSQDVIHSFYVPAFRMKQDVLPGRYTQTWFNATKPGVYPLECAEYCGTDHSRMLGEITVMSPADYGRWVASQPQPADLAAQGQQLFSRLGCSGCHGPNVPAANAPNLHGLYDAQVQLADGRAVRADEGYLRSVIVAPDQHVPAGYQPVMPSYAKAVDEQGLVALVAYIKSLSTRPEGGQ